MISFFGCSQVSRFTIWMWLSQGLWRRLCGPRLCTGHLGGRWAHEPSVPSRAGLPEPRHSSCPSTACGLWTDRSEARALVSFFLTYKAKAEARWEVQPREEGQRLDSSLSRRGLVKAVTLVSPCSWVAGTAKSPQLYTKWSWLCVDVSARALQFSLVSPSAWRSFCSRLSHENHLSDDFVDGLAVRKALPSAEQTQREGPSGTSAVSTVCLPGRCCGWMSKRNHATIHWSVNSCEGLGWIVVLCRSEYKVRKV